MNIKTRIRATMLATAMALVALVAIVVPGAQAGMFTEITHASGDSGYSAPIKIKCSDGRTASLYKGGWSGTHCGAKTDYVYVGDGQEVKCQNLFPPFGWRTYDATGWHYVDGYTQLKCYMQAD